MKKRMLAVMMAAVMMIGTAAAQPQKPEGAKREKPTPEQIAKFRTERMTKALDLNEQQQKQLYDLTLNRVNEASKKVEAARKDMEAARKSNAEQMQKILTPEQYRKWTEMQKKQAEMGRAQGQRGPQQGHWQGHGNGHHAPKDCHKGKCDGHKGKDGKCGQCHKCHKGHKGHKGGKPAQNK